MPRYQTIAVVFLLGAAACGGSDSGGSGGRTRMGGTITPPLAAQCTDCSVEDRGVTYFALAANTAPRPIHSTQSSEDGRYASGDLTSELGDVPLVLAVVDVGDGASLGGADSLTVGATNFKNLSVATRVASQAVLDLVAGTDLAGEGAADGCEVDPEGECTSGAPCWFTLYEGFFDDARIALLEDAAAFLAPRVNLQSDVFRAACAVVNCTFEGAGPASEECLDGFFP